MHAAVVRSFDHPPRYETVEEPRPSGEHELVVEMLAAGLHPRVRSSADGSHYADITHSLAGEDAYEALGEAGRDVDIVLDYLWGTAAERAIRALVTRRHDRSRPLDWIEVGSVAGPDITLPSAALRAANLRITGSGQGSVTTDEIVAQLPALAAEITAGTLTVDAVPLPLSEVEAAWNAPTAAGQRVVFVP
jgi:hypothetical protein